MSLLDDQEVSFETKSKAYYFAISCLYFFIMLGGSYFCSYFNPENPRFAQKIEAALILIIMSLFVTILTAIAKVIFSKINTRKDDQRDHEPLWYRFVEDTFAVWCILTVLTALGIYSDYYS